METENRTETLLAFREKAFMAQLRHQLFPTPLIVDRGFMEYVWDIEGRRYLDFFSGIAVVNCGHCNPEITGAVQAQYSRLQHVSTFFLSESMLRLADKLTQIVPQGLTRFYPVNSGSEAVDGAVLTARQFTGRQEVVSLYLAYHGRTLLSMALCGFTGYKVAGPLVPGLIFVPNGYCYRCPLGEEYPGCDLACAEAAEQVISASAPGPIAGIIAEPIQGVGGLIIPPPGYLQRLREIAHAHGGLFIVDEVQSGFGRAGGTMFASQSMGVIPDIMSMGKGMANGVPMAAFVTTEAVGEAQRYPTFSTYGGNPVASAAALATIEYIERHGLPQRATEIGEVALKRLREMSQEHRLMGDVRGMGLMIGVELVRDKETREPAGKEAMMVLEEARRRGLIVGKCGPQSQVLRIAPPLTVSVAQMEEGLGILDEALTAVESTLP
ncbi:MAG TPA: aspartate aminotransferase family protein [Firmicutes bacterium]|nr:aspartate aminotransferase family protein [Bacillota bacterium]